MPSPDQVNEPARKRSPYRFPAIVGGVGVLLLVLGFTLPGLGWLAWVGFLLCIAAAFTIWISFSGGWIPTLFRSDNKDDIPPPPTVER